MSKKLSESEKLNTKIREICDEPDKYGFAAFGGKSVPYIGWFWRDVNFDDEKYTFGLLPTDDFGNEMIDGYKVGFMENNKWGYPEITASPEQTAVIRENIIKVCDNPNADTLKELYDSIQVIRGDWKIIQDERGYWEAEKIIL